MANYFVRSETDLFSDVDYDLSIQSTCTNEYHPTSTITQTSPIEFFIQGNDQQYIDFSKTKLKLTCKIVNSDGADIPEETTLATLNYAPANYLLASAFDRVSVHLNETEITPKSSLYQYQAYLETLLSYGTEYKKGQAEAAGFFRVKNEKVQSDEGWKSRKELCDGSAEFELIGRPHGELFNQSRYLVPGMDVRISLHRSDSTFCLERYPHTNTSVKPILLIKEAILYVQKVSLLPSLQAKHLQAWQKSPCIYPGKRVEMKSYSLPTGTGQHTNENLLNGLIPDRVIIGLVETDNVQGSYHTNPFYFDDFGLSQIIITCNSETPTQHIVNIDKDSDKYLNGFISLFDAMGITNCDNGLDLRRKEYIQGKTLFGFDLRNLSDGFAIPRHGNCSIHLKFKKTLTKSVTVIVYPEYPSIMYISKEKQVFFKDYTRDYN